MNAAEAAVAEDHHDVSALDALAEMFDDGIGIGQIGSGRLPARANLLQ